MLVSVVGEHLTPPAGAGATPLCRFGTVDVNATAGASSGSSSSSSLQCVAPPLASTAPVSVLVSFNGQNYAGASDGLHWTSLETLVVLSLTPSSGPVMGGTVIKVLTQGVDATGDLRCRFGGKVVTAQVSVGDAPGTLLCVVPAVTTGTNVTRNVSSTTNVTIAAAGGGDGGGSNVERERGAAIDAAAARDVHHHD